MKVWLKQVDTFVFFGPYTREEISNLVSRGSLDPKDFVWLDATGQTRQDLMRAKNWAPVDSDLLVSTSGLGSVPRPSGSRFGNAEYLEYVRGRSCYQKARSWHDFLHVLAMILAVLATMFSVVATMALGERGVPALLLSSLAVVAIGIERAVFTAFLDIADVITDIGRRERDRQG